MTTHLWIHSDSLNQISLGERTSQYSLQLYTYKKKLQRKQLGQYLPWVRDFIILIFNDDINHT